jgi:hypothetical protein
VLISGKAALVNGSMANPAMVKAGRSEESAAQDGFTVYVHDPDTGSPSSDVTCQLTV